MNDSNKQSFYYFEFIFPGNTNEKIQSGIIEGSIDMITNRLNGNLIFSSKATYGSILDRSNDVNVSLNCPTVVKITLDSLNIVRNCLNAQNYRNDYAINEMKEVFENIKKELGIKDDAD